eukprot:7810524-Lingulodinium_polyedra.AAC.1
MLVRPGAKPAAQFQLGWDGREPDIGMGPGHARTARGSLPRACTVGLVGRHGAGCCARSGRRNA